MKPDAPWVQALKLVAALSKYELTRNKNFSGSFNRRHYELECVDCSYWMIEGGIYE